MFSDFRRCADACNRSGLVLSVMLFIQKSSQIWSDYILSIDLSRLRTKEGIENDRMIPELLAMLVLN